MTHTTLNVTLYQSDVLSHHSRQSTLLFSSLRGQGRFPSVHRACFWNVFSSSSSKTVGTSVGRESRCFNMSLLGEQTSRGSIAVNAFGVSFSRGNLDWMYFPHSTYVSFTQFMKSFTSVWSFPSFLTILLVFDPINIKSKGNKFFSLSCFNKSTPV